MEGPWDLIIDDGSHRCEDIVASYELLKGFVKKDGFYIVEDIYGSQDSMRFIDYIFSKHKETFGQNPKSVEVNGQLVIVKYE